MFFVPKQNFSFYLCCYYFSSFNCRSNHVVFYDLLSSITIYEYKIEELRKNESALRFDRYFKNRNTHCIPLQTKYANTRVKLYELEIQLKFINFWHMTLFQLNSQSAFIYLRESTKTFSVTLIVEAETLLRPSYELKFLFYFWLKFLFYWLVMVSLILAGTKYTYLVFESSS